MINSAFIVSPLKKVKTTGNELIAILLVFSFLYNKGGQSHPIGRHTSVLFFDPYLWNKGH